MEKLVKIAKVIANSEKSKNEVAKTLMNAGLIIITEEECDDCFYICKKVEE